MTSSSAQTNSRQQTETNSIDNVDRAIVEDVPIEPDQVVEEDDNDDRTIFEAVSILLRC